MKSITTGKLRIVLESTRGRHIKTCVGGHDAGAITTWWHMVEAYERELTLEGSR